MTPDADLVAAALAGGPEAFGPIVDRYRDAVFGIALARLGDFHDADDAAQQVFVEAFERLDGLRDPARLGAWLRSVTIHRCIDRLRRRREVGLDDAGAHPGRTPTPEDELERNELRQRVLAAIGRLSRAQRETTTLFYIDGYSVAEVAAMQEVPAGTVKRRLHDARQRLKEEMIGMVEDVMRSEAPREDFARRVFEALSRRCPRSDEPRIGWRELVAELEKIGSRGIGGFVKALESPHSALRMTAMSQIRLCESADTREVIVELLKKSLSDPNKRVRRNAVDAILRIDVDAERRRRELIPLVIELLADRSRRVRSRAAYCLGFHAADVDWRTAARALLAEKDPRTRGFLRGLLGAVLRAQGGEAKSA